MLRQYLNFILAASCLLLFSVGCSNSDSDEGNTDSPAIESIPLAGPLLYQTGSILLQSVREDSDKNEPVTTNFFTDTDNNTITDNFPFEGNDTPTLRYDENGRVTFIDSTSTTGLGRRVDYNEDGSINSIIRSGSDEVLNDNFYYEQGRLVKRIETSYCCGSEEIAKSIDYFYDDRGFLPESKRLTPGAGGVNTNSTNKFTVDSLGRVIEILEKVEDSGDFERRHVLTYDDSGNIFNHEIYSSDGALETVITNTYEPSSVPTPNFMGFLAATSQNFIPINDFN